MLSGYLFFGFFIIFKMENSYFIINKYMIICSLVCSRALVYFHGYLFVFFCIHLRVVSVHEQFVNPFASLMNEQEQEILFGKRS